MKAHTLTLSTLLYLVLTSKNESDAFSIVRPNPMILSSKISSSTFILSMSPLHFADEITPSDAISTTTVTATTPAPVVTNESTTSVAVTSDNKDLYIRLGVDEDKVALGIDENEVLEYLGNKEDLIARFMKDNPKFDRQRAELEVDKFFMDSDQMNLLVSYEKKKRELGLGPDELLYKKQYGLSDFFPVIFGYLVFNYIRNIFFPKSKDVPIPTTGDDIGVVAGSPSVTDTVDNAASTADAVVSAASTVDAVSNAIVDSSSSADSASSAMDAIGSAAADIPNAAQTLVDGVSILAPKLQTIVDSVTPPM